MKILSFRFIGMALVSAALVVWGHYLYCDGQHWMAAFAGAVALWLMVFAGHNLKLD